MLPDEGGRDIAHQALREQTAQCRMDAAGDGVRRHSEQPGRCGRRGQPAPARNLGIHIRRDDWSRPVTDFVTEECRDAVRSRQPGDIDGPFDAIGVLKDGRRLHIEVITKSDVIGGRPVRISLLRDVTERKQGA